MPDRIAKRFLAMFLRRRIQEENRWPTIIAIRAYRLSVSREIDGFEVAGKKQRKVRVSFLGNSERLQVFVAAGDFLRAPEKHLFGNEIAPCGNRHVAGRYVFVYVIIAARTDPEPGVVKQNRLVRIPPGEQVDHVKVSVPETTGETHAAEDGRVVLLPVRFRRIEADKAQSSVPSALDLSSKRIPVISAVAYYRIVLLHRSFFPEVAFPIVYIM